MSCVKCGIEKKTIKALKMHIKLTHLRTGRYRCKLCEYSANIVNSIETHFKIRHPEAEDGGQAKFEEKAENESQSFSHEFWKAEWNIPTLQERKAALLTTTSNIKALEFGGETESGFGEEKEKGKKRKNKKSAAGNKGKRKKLDSPPPPPAAAAVVQSPPPPPPPPASALLPPASIDEAGALSVQAAQMTPLAEPTGKTLKALEQRIMEISPFEHNQTYKCNSCPKRSQNLERIQRHLTETPAHVGFKTLSRDQVVDMITLRPAVTPAEGRKSVFQCFFCDDLLGDIRLLSAHFEADHRGQVFKVKSGESVNGYLECQICGHLTPGFERSKQKIHFNEEHPLEGAVNCSKYVSKSSSNSTTTAAKKDLSRFNGLELKCPKKGCDFGAKSLSAINSHLRKHTQTFKCGQCGKTSASSSEFHQHTAMMHGDKIPDLVRDPEADAALEALKGLLEADLIERYDEGVKRNEKTLNLARKSTGGGGKKIRGNFARKSTGGGRCEKPRTEFSFYGVEPDPIDLEAISARISMGGIEIPLSAAKMAELVKLHPKVYVRPMKPEEIRRESD